MKRKTRKRLLTPAQAAGFNEVRDLTNAEFRDRIATICGVQPRRKSSVVRTPEDRGYYPPKKVRDILHEIPTAEERANAVVEAYRREGKDQYGVKI
jgi:hypothetical protein